MFMCLTNTCLTISQCFVADEYESNVKSDDRHFVESGEAAVAEAEIVGDLAVTKEESPAETREEQSVPEEPYQSAPDIVKEGGHFNKNKDDQPSFSAAEEMHQARQDFPESTLEVDLIQGPEEPEYPSSGWRFNVFNCRKSTFIHELNTLTNGIVL